MHANIGLESPNTLYTQIIVVFYVKKMFEYCIKHLTLLCRWKPSAINIWR